MKRFPQITLPFLNKLPPALLTAFICAALAINCPAQTVAAGDASKLEASGDFRDAAHILQRALASENLTPTDRKTLEFDLDRLDRIQKDFSWTKERLFDEVKKSVKDVTQDEYEAWVRQGWFEGRVIDGRMYYFTASISNLFFRHPELNPRRVPPKDNSKQEKLLLETVNSIEQAASSEKSPYVLPERMHVTMTVTAHSNAAPDGKIIRAWAPIPRRYPYQTDFKLVSSSSQPKVIDDEDSAIRSIYFEEPAEKDKSTEFKFQYDYTIRGVHFDLQPNRIQPYDPNDDAVKQFTKEGPHVIFTPEIKEWSAKIVGGETNSMLKAKKIYDWLSENLLYSFALEYSTIPNIGDYCRSHGYGDCGEQAMLFITLCRDNGIPARWQSGWDLLPGAIDIHDWSEIYLPPYGWVPVDPYRGNYAMRYTTTLTPEQKKLVRDFYFGGLDEFRMAANSDHSQMLNPPKKTFRSDNVDFQRGELESGTNNLYFDKYSFHLEYKMEPASSLP